MHSQAQRVLRALPAVLLVVVAGWQAVRVETHDQSPWIGAGFSMFSYVDASAYRPLVVTAADDPTVTITVGDRWKRDVDRLLAAPSDERAARLAEALSSEVSRAVRVEVWRPLFDGDSLVVAAELIASGEAGDP